MKNIIYAPFLILLMSSAVKAQTVTLDCYFNHEVHKTASGEIKRFHYLWTDTENSGFSKWGELFKSKGAKLDTLGEAPTAKNLRASNIYIIVDPDTKKENPNPHYIEATDTKEIAAWVKTGGILVLMANDSINVELPHFNNLAAKFGMHFNNDLQNHVIDDNHFEDGASVPFNTSIFKTARKLFLKDVCSISLNNKQAVIALKSPNGATIAAIVKYGKGTVFAVGDPWLYNEYVNGRLPAGFDNDKAADDLTVWLIKQSKMAR
ncbi:MAG TPA: hypothetical protein VK668_12275 [Mucilaginibacter sp.]|nr:hypothetical protein [Mucilaginibacter sp.]